MERRDKCPLCGAAESKILVTRPYDDAAIREYLAGFYGGREETARLASMEYALLRCTRCGFAWQRDTLDESGMEALYARWIDATESARKKEAADQNLYWRYAREVHYIGTLFPQRAPHEMRVLDFGSGWGVWCRMALAFGTQAHGIEIAPDRVAFAKYFGLESFPSIEALPPGSYSFINAEQVFEHVPDPRGELQRLAGRLEPGGFMHIAVPEGGSELRSAARGVWAPQKGATQPLEHINVFTPKTLVSLAERAGLRWYDDGRAPFRGIAPGLRRRFARLSGPRSTSLYFKKGS